jgi:hypothetical protein
MNKSITKVLCALALSAFVLGFLPLTAYAASPGDVVLGSNYTLQSGQTVNDGLVVLGGNVNLQAGSTVIGDIFLLGGNVQAAGTVHGNIIALGGTLTLADTFVLNGDLNYAGTSVVRSPGAQITGQINTGNNPSTFVLPGGVNIPEFIPSFNPVFRLGGFFLRLFLWALVAMLVAMFVPTHLSRTSETAFKQPLISGGLGFLTIIVVPIVLLLLLITICLSPISLIGALLLVVAWVFGLIAIGVEVGKRISLMLKQEWHPAIIAGAGTLLLMLVLSGVEALIPCIGWIPKALVGFVGLGAVLLTQFGRKPYNPAAGSAQGLPPGGSSDAVLPPPTASA